MIGPTKYIAIFTVIGLAASCNRSVPPEEVHHSPDNTSVATLPTPKESPPTAAELDARKIHVGDTFGLMEVVSILPYTDSEITPDNFKIQLKGKVKLVGKYEVASSTKNEFLVPGTVSFEPDKGSLALLPPVKPAGNTWFILVNVAPGHFSASSGQATIVIDNYLICSYPSDEVCNYADLEELIDAKPNSEPIEQGVAAGGNSGRH